MVQLTRPLGGDRYADPGHALRKTRLNARRLLAPPATMRARSASMSGSTSGSGWSWGVSPEEETRWLYMELRNRVDDRHISPEELRAQLREQTPAAGAILCDFSTFRQYYQTKARLADRRGDAIHIGALTVVGKPGYLPNVDDTLATGKGIRFDYAALMAAMLRSQKVPVKLIVGYTGEAYHAWINVYSGTEGWMDAVIYFNGSEWKLMDPTFASSGKQSAGIMK